MPPQPPTVCFDMTLPEYESALASGEIPDYLEAHASGESFDIHISCGLYPLFLRPADSWYLVALDKDTEAYQLFYLPPFSRSVLLQVTAKRGQAPTVSATRFITGTDTLAIDRATSRTMSRAEWLQWSRIVDELGFWSDESPLSAEPVVCFDGSTYILEGSRFERGSGTLSSVKHKVWNPYCPQGETAERLWSATSFLFEITETYPDEQ